MENEVEVGYSQRTGGANGLLTSVNCIGNPNVVALTPGVFAPNCYLIQQDATTGFVQVVWINTGTTAVPVWTLATTQQVNTVALSLTSAQILALNTTPIVLIPAPLAGQVIQVLSVTGQMTFATAAYATNTELDIIDTTAGTKLFFDTGTLLAATSTKAAQIEPAIAANAGNLITPVGSVSVKVLTGNPITGAGTLKLYATYRIITL